MHQAPDFIDFSALTPDEIAQTLRKFQLNLTVDEALTIQHSLLKRAPTFAECVLWSIQGSEHCSYKSSRKHLKQLVTESPDVILGAKEDAGIVTIATDHQGRRYGLVISHESHNHPSQIVPYEGAATGVGGNVRDVCCMGATVIAVADGLRFGDFERAKTHFIQSGVVAGIAGYGNPLGIPNIAGDVYYHPGYNENCLVTVVTLGIVREDNIIHSYAPANANDHVYILVGKPTDNSGFGGASFASLNLEENSHEQNKGAVQEPNAFLQRHLLKANYALFQTLRETNRLDQVGFKDLGAGGIACASVEMAESAGYGAEINLDLVPTSMSDLHPAVVLCSETQERFMWLVPPDLVNTVLDHYNTKFDLPGVSQGACAKVVGTIRSDDLYVVKAKESVIVNAKALEVTKGILYDRPAAKKSIPNAVESFPKIDDYSGTLLDLLQHQNIASKRSIFEAYDKQVQGRTYLEAGVSDAGVLQPFNEQQFPEEIRNVGVALSLDQNPRYNEIDAYWGAVNAVVEAVRNVTAVGSLPIAITDCLCFGNPENAEQMGEFVDAVRGIADACLALTLRDHQNGLPVIAGNVSFYNESKEGAIPPSPMISCVGVLPDVKHAVTFSFKQPDSLVLMINERLDELGGSVFYELHGLLGDAPPKPNFEKLNQEIRALHTACTAGLISACHDIADGGIAVAIAEMTFENEIGVRIDIPGSLSLERKLFSETGGFVIEVSRDNYTAVKKIFNEHAVDLFIIGETTRDKIIRMQSVIVIPVSEAKNTWENGITKK